MILSLDFSSDTPIYIQIRNQIILGISDGRLAPGEKLPTNRSLAMEIGVNTMTVNKAYQLLKQEGYIITERRNGAMVSQNLSKEESFMKRSHEALKLLISEAKINGVKKEEFLNICSELYEEG